MKQGMSPIQPIRQEGPAPETGMLEKQRSERTVAEAGEPVGEDAAWETGEEGVGEDNRIIVAVQDDFAYLRPLFGRQSEFACFLAGQRGQALCQ